MILTLAMLTAPADAACTDNLTLTSASTGEARELGDAFGSVVATGDFDNDGYDDLVVASPNEDWDGKVNAGIITVHYGPLSSSPGYSRWSQNSIDGAANESGDKFGSTLAVGDFNGDGVDDLAIGTPQEDHAGYEATGRVSVKYGIDGVGLTSGAPSASFGQDDVPGVGEEDNGYFGGALAVGDFNADGIDDLAASSSGSTIDGEGYAGRVVIFYGTEEIPGHPDPATELGGLGFANAMEGFNIGNFGLTPEYGDSFGVALAAGNFDNYAGDDLAIGVPNRDHSGATDPGMVLVKFSNPFVTLKNSYKQMTIDADDINAVARDGDRMGQHLTAGALNTDLYQDLVIGIPEKEVNGVDDAGLVGVVWGAGGTSNMLSGAQHLRSTGVGISEVVDNNFGGEVFIGDAEWPSRLYVGMPGAYNDEGRIIEYAQSGSTQSLPDTVVISESCMGGSNNADQRFGTAITVGDYNGDGPRLAAGDPLHTPSIYGAVFVSEIF